MNQYEQEKKRVTLMRSIANYGMGVFFILAGIFFLVYAQLGIDLGMEPSPLDLVIGGLFVIYGIWRVYRGYKKNYFK
ncbi:hypothetical protein V9K67_06180 [Paraflavisolibacter sp. H34]|uniref:hypothetical protein n=1 Tax=Huijunlia imazamoxiresistens TaxID=3127457 RepID=UPI003017A4BD